jgi:hypothetical protein
MAKLLFPRLFGPIYDQGIPGNFGGNVYTFYRLPNLQVVQFFLRRLCAVQTWKAAGPDFPYGQPRPWPGRATAQAVSCRLPTAAARVQIRVWSCGILCRTKVALRHGFSENFGFPCQSTFHLLLHNHLHYHPRLAQ